jgi:adenosylcobinamide kinase / adenosylcobinamide-phosphate guanylyltransferase
MKKIYMITGGVRSGKSRLGLELAETAKSPFFIATAWAGDDEMEKRIKNHKAERSEKWTTIEERFDLGSAVKNAINNAADLIVIDCVTLWVTNIMLGNKDIDVLLNQFILVLKSAEVPVVLVTNEVGLGIVPEAKLARDYRDLLGSINQKLAGVATDVLFMVSGIPMKVK